MTQRDCIRIFSSRNPVSSSSAVHATGGNVYRLQMPLTVPLHRPTADICLPYGLCIGAVKESKACWFWDRHNNHGPETASGSQSQCLVLRVKFYGRSTLKHKCRHLDEFLVTAYTRSCDFGTFRCSKWQKLPTNNKWRLYSSAGQ